MLLDPWCTGSITSSRQPLCLEIAFSFLTKTKLDQALQSHFDWKIWPRSTQFWLGSFLLVTLLWGTL